NIKAQVIDRSLAAIYFRKMIYRNRHSRFFCIFAIKLRNSMNGRVFFLIGLFIALVFSCKETAQSVIDGDYTYKDGKVIYSGSLGEEVMVQITALPSSLHPTNGRHRSRDRILDLVSQELIDLDIRSREMVPTLLKELPVLSADGLSLSVELDPDASWPDGSPILAEDILFSYKAAAVPLTDNPQQKGLLEYLKDITLDPQNTRKCSFNFSSYYMYNRDLLSSFQIIDKRTYDPENILAAFELGDLLHSEQLANDEKLKAWADEFNDAKYGIEKEYINKASGPYEIEEWSQGGDLVFKKKDNYWGKGKSVYYHKQLPPKITFKPMRDPDAIELQIASQKIDVAELASESYKRLEIDSLAKQNYRFEITDRATFVSLPLNTKPTASGRPPLFTDKKTRQALTYALPIDEMIQSFMGDENFAKRIASPVSSMSPDHHPDLNFYPHDPEKAKSLLKEAGWEDTDSDLIIEKEVDGKKVPFSFELIYPANNQTLIGFATKIKEELAKVGIECELAGVNGQELAEKLWSRNYDMGLLGLSSTHLPYDFDQFFYSENWPEGDNIYGFANEEADKLIQAARVERDQAKRKDMVYKIQEIIYDEKPCIFLFAPTKKLAIHKRFNGSETYSIVDHLILNEFELIR
ncbi:MAG: ABC transporter substrate-binding protein, partial [Bacteroidota bacterium]